MRVDRIPASLRDLKRWVLWRYVERDGRRTKAPYQPSGRPAKSNSPVTWTTLDVALEALQRGGFDGLGFVLGDGITGVDLDWKSYQGEGVPVEAQTVVDRLNSYTEWSPSHRGCHILLRGSLSAGARNRYRLAPGVELEVYDHGRFFTATAERWAGYPLDLEERQAELAALLHDLAPPAPEPEHKPAPSAPVDLSDSELLERMFASRNGAEIRRLWDGDITGYPSHSEADLALAGHLMWWTGNDQARADRLFRQSGLYRDKWDERHFSDGKTYGEATLERARAAGGYTPGPVAHGRLAGGTPHPLEGRTGGGLVLGQPRYKVENGRILAAKLEGRGEHQAVSYYPLANFACTITREVVSTDGLETETLFEIQGYTSTGRPLPVAQVRASEFAGMGWVQRCWGAGAIVTPGQGAKDHLRAAIQYLSLEAGSLEQATVYRHLGWARLGDTWVYLHSSGGIGAEGAVPGLEVSPGRVLENFALPEPPAGEGERGAITALWGLLEVAPHRVTVPLLLYALAAPLGHSPFSLYLAGPTGARKTSLALVVQNLWGFLDSPPLAWEGTANALEGAAFLAKDALLLVDDYAPQASEGKQKELQSKAGRLLRSQGNGTGRPRMRPDGSLAGDRPPRGSLLVTGEDLPPGYSIRARCLFVELERGDVDLHRLTEAQRLARQGVYARGLAAWLRWLAADLEAHQRRVTERTAELRPRWESSHGRTADALARLHAVWELYCDYTATVGVSLAHLEGVVLEALDSVRRVQGSYQRDSDPAERFGALLFAALRMGRAHLVPVGWRPGQSIEDYLPAPSMWGWRWRDTTSGAPDAHGVWEPQGPAIGWLPDDPETHGLYLDPSPAYAVLTRLANETGEPLPTERTLWKRLAERGAIRTSVEGGVVRYQARVRIGQSLHRVVHLAGSYITKSGNSGNIENNAVQDDTKPVPSFLDVPTNQWEQNPAPDGDSGVFPLASGNIPPSGNSISAVQDAIAPVVPTVPTRGDIRGTPLAQEGDEGVLEL